MQATRVSVYLKAEGLSVSNQPLAPFPPAEANFGSDVDVGNSKADSNQVAQGTRCCSRHSDVA